MLFMSQTFDSPVWYHSSVIGTLEEKVLFEACAAIINAQRVLAAEADPTPLVETIKKNVPVHRAAFQLALHAIYLEPTCRIFLERVAKASHSVLTRSGNKPRQSVHDLRSLYTNARQVQPKFDQLMAALAKASGGNYINADLKSPVRVLEKVLLQADVPSRRSCARACDVVRGGLEYSYTGKLTQAFELLLACDVNECHDATLKSALLGANASDLKIVIVRIKDRFNNPNPSGCELLTLFASVAHPHPLDSLLCIPVHPYHPSQWFLVARCD